MVRTIFEAYFLEPGVPLNDGEGGNWLLAAFSWAGLKYVGFMPLPVEKRCWSFSFHPFPTLCYIPRETATI